MIEIRLKNTHTDVQKTVYPLESFIIPYGAINENLQHQEVNCQFQLEYDAEVFELLIESEELSAVVYDGNEAVFTGSIRRDITWTDNGYPLPMDNITLTIEDNTKLFKKSTDNEVAFINKTIGYIIQKVCMNCGVTIAAGQTMKQTVVEAFVLDAGTSYLDHLNTLLFQYGYAFTFNGRGEFVTIDIISQPSSLVPITEEDFYTGLQIQRNSKNYTGIKVSYNNLIKKENEQVYWQGKGLNDENKVVPIIIRPNQYYPYESDPVVESDEGQVYQTFENGYAESYELYNGEKKFRRTNKTTLVYTENHEVVQDWEGTLSINRTQFGARQSSVRFLNQSSKDVSLYQFAIRADAYYRSDDVTLNYGDASDPYEYQSEYIYNATVAQNFAEFLSRFFMGSGFKIVGKLATNLPVGTHVNIDTGLSGFICNAVITAVEYDCKEEKYKLTFASYGQTAVLASRYKHFSSNYGSFSLSQTVSKNIQSITPQFYLSSSALEPTGGEWLDTSPEWISGKFIWTRTKIAYNSGDIAYAGVMRITNPDSVSVDGVEVQYAFGDNGITPPTDGWSVNAPSWQEGRYIWSRIVTKLTNSSVTISNPACLTGQRGEAGASLKYLGLLDAVPVSANEGEFFLCKTSFNTSEAGRLILTNGKALKLLNGNFLITIGKSYTAGYIYYLDHGMWLQVSDKNDYRYISASNDLLKMGWPLAENLQNMLTTMDEDAQGYAATAEQNAKDYAAQEIQAKSEQFIAITEELEESVTSVTNKVADISSDSKLTPDEKMTLLKEWTTIIDEYSALTEEAKKIEVSTEEYTVAYLALATWLNGGNTWTSEIPFYIQNQRLGITEDIKGSAMRTVFADYNTEKTNLVNAISDRYAELRKAEAEAVAKQMTDGLKTVIQTLGNKYLGLLATLPATANEGEFFLCKQAFQDTGADRVLLLLNGKKLKLLNGKSLLLKKAYQPSFLYVLVNGLWTQISDRNDYRYISASNDLLKMGWKLSDNLQGLLNEMDADAQGYADKAEQNANAYTKTVSDRFESITNSLDENVRSVNQKVSGITSDNVLSPDEKLTLLREWIIMTQEYTVILVEAEAKNLDSTVYQNAYKAVAQSLNGDGTWTSGIPVWLQAQWIGVYEDLTAYGGGENIRNQFAAYNTAKTNLVNAINEKYADNKKSEAIQSSAQYTDKAIGDLQLDNKFEEIGTALGNKLDHIPVYLGPKQSEPSASEGDWYLNTADGNVYQYKNGSWNKASTSDNNLYTPAVIKDGLDLASTTGNAAIYAIAWIAKIFTKNIVFDEGGSLKSSAFKESDATTPGYHGTFRLKTGKRSSDNLVEASEIYIDIIKALSGYISFLNTNNFQVSNSDIPGYDFTLNPTRLAWQVAKEVALSLSFSKADNKQCPVLTAPHFFVQSNGVTAETQGMGAVNYAWNDSSSNHSYYEKSATGLIKMGGRVYVTEDFQQVTFSSIYSSVSFNGIIAVQLTPFNQAENKPDDTNYEVHPVNITTTGFQIRYRDTDGSDVRTGWVSWEATGY